jgi:hypothetical protein
MWRLTPRAYALLIAIVLGLIGLGGLVPGASHSPPYDAPALIVAEGYGFVLGLFPVNALDCVLYLTFAAWGAVSWMRLTSAATFARMTTVYFALLTVMGLVEPANTAFGLLPVFGADVVLHGMIAVSAALFGFIVRHPSAAPN